ncbi:MAG TPA: SRPBCC family protein [Caulobacteraceae bacterium]|nr:SRPBCC family protein [Caulobacteraceae bacterium]
MTPTRLAMAATALAVLAGGARAEVTAVQANGFEVVEKATIAASPARVWQAIGRIGDWWSSEHTFSRDAHNLSLSLQPGGCFCERFPGGGGGHFLTVIMVRPNAMLRLEGALGPLAATGATGHLTFELAPAAAGTALTLTYAVGGWTKSGFDQWAPPVDSVLEAQVGRLKRYVETGRPD